MLRSIIIYVQTNSKLESRKKKFPGLSGRSHWLKRAKCPIYVNMIGSILYFINYGLIKHLKNNMLAGQAVGIILIHFRQAVHMYIKKI